MRLSGSAVLIATLCATPLWAQCADGKAPLVSCQVGAKSLNVCFNTTTEILTYRYGPDGAPELELQRGVHDLTLRTWSGVGKSIVENLEITNKGYVYQIFAGHNRMDHTNFAGVSVIKDGKRLADFTCTRGGGGAWVFDPISEVLQTYGYCTDDNGYYHRDETCAK